MKWEQRKCLDFCVDCKNALNLFDVKNNHQILNQTGDVYNKTFCFAGHFQFIFYFSIELLLVCKEIERT